MRNGKRNTVSINFFSSLLALVLVESGGQTTALSPKGARGIWQFMPDTARRYGLTVNPRQDERLDLRKATRAAARYLRDLHSQFGDWPLALAAYNAGKQAVQQALKRDQGGDFLALSAKRLLPADTSNYVPAVLAALQLFSGYERRQFPLSSTDESALWLPAETHIGTMPAPRQGEPERGEP